MENRKPLRKRLHPVLKFALWGAAVPTVLTLCVQAACHFWPIADGLLFILAQPAEAIEEAIGVPPFRIPHSAFRTSKAATLGQPPPIFNSPSRAATRHNPQGCQTVAGASLRVAGNDHRERRVYCAPHPAAGARRGADSVLASLALQNPATIPGVLLRCDPRYGSRGWRRVGQGHRRLR